MSRDLCGILYADFEFSGVPSGRIPRKGKQPKEAYGALFVSTLEFKGGNHIEKK